MPAREQQILNVHADFICRVVELSRHPESRPELEEWLSAAAGQGWVALVGAIRRILAGERDLNRLQGLDEEDRVIAEAILRGLQNPAGLPDPKARANPALAAPGLAGMIHAAATGQVEALQILSHLAEQMSRTGGPMARLAAVIRPLINGERDPERLCKGMDAKTRQLVLGILDELGKLVRH